MINLILQNYNNKCNNYDSKGEDKMNKEIEKAINSLERMLDICKLEMNELPESMETEMFEVELGNKENHINIICQYITKQEEKIENKRKAFEHMQYISQEHLDKLDKIREICNLTVINGLVMLENYVPDKAIYKIKEILEEK